MKRFLNGRTKRCTTAIVLIAWLFGLGSGIVNACLFEGPRGTHFHTAISEAVPHAHAGTGQAPGTNSHTDHSPSNKALCLDACDDRAHALLKQDTSIDQPHLAALTLVAVIWLPTQPIESAVRLERNDYGEPFDVPIRVRYSRLTL